MSATTLRATNATVAEFRNIQRTLKTELERIAAMTDEYPVVCTFAGHRFVFESRQDVLDLIARLDEALNVYQNAA
jgi:hypothetical protein